MPVKPVPDRELLHPPLRATKSLKLSFELVLEEGRRDAEEREHHEQEHGLHRDRVHGGGQLLQGRPGLG